MAKNYHADKITLRAGRCCRRLFDRFMRTLKIFSSYLLHHSGLHVNAMKIHSGISLSLCRLNKIVSIPDCPSYIYVSVCVCVYVAQF